MAKRRKWITGVDAGDNSLLYVCLKTWPNKESPSLSTGNWKLKASWRGQLWHLWWHYGVANLGSEWFSFLGICKIEDVTGRHVWILQNNVNQVQWKAGTQRFFQPSRENHSRKTQWNTMNISFNGHFTQTKANWVLFILVWKMLLEHLNTNG